MADPPHRSYPPALVTSVLFGSLGLVLILVSLATGNNGLAFAGVATGTISLVAALVWREQLIEAWRARQDRD